MHISESFLQDLNSSEHSNPGLTGSRELLMLIFAGPCDFNQPGPGFCWPRLTLAPILQWTFLRQKPPWICMHPQLKTSPILLLGGGLLWEIFLMFPLLVANKIIPFPTLCLGCAFWLHTHQEVNPVSSNTDPSLAPWNQEVQYPCERYFPCTEVQGILITKEGV